MMRAVPPAPQPRHIWLCADDYGIAPGVNGAIRDLIARGRINATSVMVMAPSFSRSEAEALAGLNEDEKRAAIGLHVTMTAPFMPMTSGYSPLREGAFLPLEAMLLAAFLQRLNRDRLAKEIAAQIEAFVSAFGRTPDFVDGHQHVHLFPQVRDAFLSVVKEMAPQAWVRQCGRSIPLRRRFDRKAMLLDVLSYSFRRRAGAKGMRTNSAFAGAYDFRREPDFAKLFPRFLHRLPPESVVMCHPGVVDDELKRLDPLTIQREREYAYLGSDALPATLAAYRLALS
ncbi:MAG TPA: ChbG/HpnK family deacetylase [Xanthobacteraceae bacterium]|nr:ChbG/HpnK family deacetylase [Xanthobacteraceae bacterium]